VIVYWFLKLKSRFLHIDDTLDTFSCHAIGGIVGAFCTGLFCQNDVNTQGPDGAFFGNPVQMWKQIAGILVVSPLLSFLQYCLFRYFKTVGFSAVCTAGILLPMQLTFGIRLNPDDQIVGMDMTGHGESWFGPTTQSHRSTIVENKNKVSPHIPPTIGEDTTPV